MKIKWGSYTHPSNEMIIAISRESSVNAEGVVEGVLHRWDMQGLLMEDSQSALDTAIANIETQYATGEKDLKLLFDDDSEADHQLLTASCNGGTRVVRGPSFLEGRGVEYALTRTFSVTIEGEILDSGGAGTVLEWQETLQFSGGGPAFSYLQTVNGLPQKQLTAEATPYRVIQQGSAKGRDAYPAAATPLWASDHHQNLDSITYGFPKKMGRGSSVAYTMYPISWRYEFTSDTVLVGTPTAAPSGS